MNSRPKILVVDDSAASLEAIGAALATVHATPILVRSGQDALREAMSCDALAVVVLDVTMPGMGGFEVAELLRDRPRFANTPIIFMTGVATEQHEIFLGYELGAVDYIFKPVDPHILRSKVSVFVELKRLHATLEQRVEERTSELREAYRALQEETRQREKLHEEMVQAQKMEAIGQIASGVAHDYNNLLMGIRGCVDIALKGLPKDDPSRVYLEEAKRATQRGSTLTRQLLVFSRKKSGETRDVSLNSVVEDTEKMIRSLIGDGERVDIFLAAPDWRVRADEGRLEQVLMNLVVNARDATPPGGEIRVSTAQVTVGEDDADAPAGLAPGQYVTLTVSDDGCGMDADAREQAFEPFFTTKDVGRGTGLGLSTVRRIVEDGRGHIELESSVGEGTTFTIYLPRAPASRAEIAKPEREIAEHRGGGTALIIDDEPLVRLTLRCYLEAAGYSVIEACDTSEARFVSRQHPGPIDLVLSDIMIPGGTGPEVVREIEAERGDLVVIYMSAHSREALVESGRLDPDTRLLQKPFGEDTLMAELGRATRGSSGAEARSEASSKPAEAHPFERSVERSNGASILVVEDSRGARLAISSYLAELGYRVLVAAKPTEALKLSEDETEPIQLLLTDYSLPEMKGDALAAEVRKRWPAIEVIYMSGFESLPFDPGEHFIRKPFALDDLVKMVEGSMHREPEA